MKIHLKIETSNDWKKIFPPAGKDKQWKDGHSAKEFAKIVLGEYENIDFEKSLEKIGVKKIHTNEVYPEKLSQFDNNNRGPRHHDLALIGEKENGKKVAMCFEAKVNEPLDKKLSEYRKESDGKKKRCDTLCKHFFGNEYKKDYDNVYYQILSSVAGSIAFAQENKIDEVIFVLYQLVPKNSKNKDYVQKHINALNEFIKFTKNGARQVDIKNTTVNIGKLSIERRNNTTDEMCANVTIAYIEQEI